MAQIIGSFGPEGGVAEVPLPVGSYHTACWKVPSFTLTSKVALK